MKKLREEFICSHCGVKIPKGYGIEEGADCPICEIGTIVLKKDIIKMLHEQNICDENGVIIGADQKLTSKNFNKVMMFLDNYKLDDKELRNNVNFYIYQDDSKKYKYAIYLPVEITRNRSYEGYNIYAKNFKVSKQKFKEYLKKAPERRQQMFKEDAEQLKRQYEEQASNWQRRAKEEDMFLKMLNTK